MKLAAAINQSSAEIARVFEEADGFIMFTFGDVENEANEMIGRMGINSDELPDMLAFLEADALICGMIHGDNLKKLYSHGITVYTGNSGSADKLFADFLCGKLSVNDSKDYIIN